MDFAAFSKPKNRWIVSLGVVAVAMVGTTSFWAISQFGSRPAQPVESAPTVRKVAALGRLEPEAEVTRLSAPVALDGDRVAQLLVKPGDRVKAGQVIAILDSRYRLQNAFQQAQEQVQVAEAKLAQIKAGAKTGEIQAQQASISRLQADRQGEIVSQQAEISRWESEVRNAQSEYDRFQKLYREGAIATSNLDSRRLASETAQAQLNQAKAK
jgi:HlyD family secretion protein